MMSNKKNELTLSIVPDASASPPTSEDKTLVPQKTLTALERDSRRLKRLMRIFNAHSGKDLEEIFTDLQKQVEELKEQAALATIDPLTRLGNRLAFKNRFEYAQAEMMRIERDNPSALRKKGRGEREETHLGYGLIFIDGDHFGEINKKFGDQTGDAVIKEIADSLKRNIRATDFVSRKGGDEFVILMKGPLKKGDLEHMIYGQGGLQQKVNTTTSVNYKGQTLPIHCSMGFSLFGPNDKMEDVLAAADTSMRANKASRKLEEQRILQAQNQLKPD